MEKIRPGRFEAKINQSVGTFVNEYAIHSMMEIVIKPTNIKDMPFMDFCV